MRFLSIYKGIERTGPPSPEDMIRMGKLVEEGMKAGYLLDVQGCLPSVFGARVRLADGNITVTDGPFSESKEVVGGLAIIRANSKAEAIEYTKRFLLNTEGGECELRQLAEAGEGCGQQQSATLAQAS